MSLIIPPNQPFAFNYPVNECDICDPREFCKDVLMTEDQCFQLSQSPCGPNLICDPNFNYIAFNLIENGDFLLDPSTNGWTLGTNWTWDNINFNVNLDALVGRGYLMQHVTGLTPGKWYALRFIISNATGNVTINPYLGGQLSSTVSTASGLVEMFLFCGGSNDELRIYNNVTTANFDIDNIELYETSPCWAGNQWWDTSNGGYVTHTSGSTGDLTQVIPPLTAGKYYRVTFVILNYVSGSVTPFCGTQLGTAVSENGIFTQYITANGTAFGFRPTSDFVGNILEVECKILINAFTFDILNYYNDELMAVVTNIDATIGYYNQFITACFSVQDILISYGICIKIRIHDLCSYYYGDIVTDGSFNNGFTSWINISNWFVGFRSFYALGTYNANLRQVYRDENGNPIVLTNTKYAWRIKITGDFPAPYLGVTPRMELTYGNQFLAYIYAPGVWEGVTTIPPPINGYITVYWRGSGNVADAAMKIYIDDVSIWPVTDVDDYYYSQCFKGVNEMGCTKLIEAWNDNNNNGFNFVESGFRLTHRVPVVSVNPIYPSGGSDYIYSDGTRKIISSQREKFWNMKIDFSPEWTHDCISLQRLCNHFRVDYNDYFVKIDDYAPNYLGNNDYVRLATASIELRKKDDTLFIRNCE